MQTEDNLIFIFILFLAIILGFSLSFYMHPQQEHLFCDKNYNCTMDTTYFGNLLTTRKFVSFKNALYQPIAENHFKFKGYRLATAKMVSDGIEYHHNYINSDNTTLKLKTYKLIQENEYEKVETQERNNFENYIENPDLTYEITNILDYENRCAEILLSIILVGLILCITVLPIICWFLEKDKKKILKEKERIRKEEEEEINYKENLKKKIEPKNIDTNDENIVQAKIYLDDAVKKICCEKISSDLIFKLVENEIDKNNLKQNELNMIIDVLVLLDKSIELNDKNHEAYYYRGYVKSALKDMEGAIEDFTKALELGSYHNEIKETIEELKQKINEQNK